MNRILLVIATLLFYGRSQAGVIAKPDTVRIKKNGKEWVLLRNGSPYFINGAGGWTHLQELKAAGGNSVRTWGGASDGAVLDEAHALGLTVTFGIWLGHRSEGFDYRDARQVREQFQRAEQLVKKYKNHPALLIWGVGNEMETSEDPKDNWADHAVWDAVEEIARMIKRIDPNHPVITAVADFDQAKISAIQKYCPSLDALGVNAYSSLMTVPARLKACGWDKPYVITEGGSRGSWETIRTAWGSPVEQSSTAKAYDYLSGFGATVQGQKGWCLGGYMYFWGVEPNIVKTHTWFESFLPGREERLGVVDAMTLLWTGKVPLNRAPEILSYGTDAAMGRVAPGSQHTAYAEPLDPDGDSLTIAWDIRQELEAEAGPAPPVVAVVMEQEGHRLKYMAPVKPGAYRLFVYVYDGKGAAATANMPFYVEKPGGTPE